jgi:hypothetical protein
MKKSIERRRRNKGEEGFVSRKYLDKLPRGGRGGGGAALNMGLKHR